MECTADCNAAVRRDKKSDDEKLYIKKMRACMNEGLHFPSGATKLFDFLYLGSEDEATNLHLLSELGITHVINCAAGYCLFCIDFLRFVCSLKSIWYSRICSVDRMFRTCEAYAPVN